MRVLSPSERDDLLRRLERAEQEVAAVRARLAAEARPVPDWQSLRARIDALVWDEVSALDEVQRQREG